MTAEAGECNGRCGDLKAEKEKGGSCVIVNGVSGDRREEEDRDRDPAEKKKKIDLGNGHGIGAKEGESGRLRSENGDLWEIEVKATENGDGESSGENSEGREEDGVSVSEIPGAQQNELASAAAETMPELESEMPDAETKDGGRSESHLDVEESEPVTASETFEPVDSVAGSKVLSAQQPEEPVSNELVPATKVEIEENHDNSSETKSGSDIVFVDTESRRASESIIEVEDAKEPELEENRDNGNGPKLGSDMKVEVHEDEPDTVVIGTENRDQSRSQDEDTKMEGKKDDDNEIKLACDTKLEILKAKPEIADVEAEDSGGLESAVVKISEPVTALEMSVVEGIVIAELDSVAENEVRSTQQPEDSVNNELVPAMKVEIEENHVNSSGTKLASNIVLVDTEGQRESGSPVGLEDVKEPEIEENHDNGSDMKDKPDTVVVGTENCNESASHVEVEDVKEQKLTIVSESVAPAVDDTGSHSDPVDTELGKVAEVEEEHKDEGMKVEMERKNADDTEIKFVSDMKVEVLELKHEIADVEAEDGGGLELPIEVKESEPVTASEKFEPLVEGIVAAELDSGTDVEIRSAQQPEYPIGDELVPATEKEIEENHVNSSETKSRSDIVFVDTEGRRESGSSVEVEDVKEPEIQENHDNSSRTKSGSDTTDMKVEGQEDKPDTVVVTTENQNESELHEDEGMKVDMEGKNDDNTEIKLVSDTNVVLEPKPEIAIVDTQDQEESESPVEVKELKTIIVAESVEPVVDETVNAEVETAAEVEVNPSQQPEYPATKDDKGERKKLGYIPEEFVVTEANIPELESSAEVESTVNAEVATAAEVEEFVVEETDILELQSAAGVEPTVNAELETAAELKVDPSWQLEHPPATDDKVEEEEEERKESGSVLEELKIIHELESPTEVKPTVDAEEIKKSEAVIEEDDNADAESSAKFKGESRQEPGVEDDEEVVIEATHIPDLESPPKVKTNGGIKVESRQNPEAMDVDNDRVEAEEQKEEGSVLEEAMPKGSNITELEFAGEVEFRIEEEEKRAPESMVLEANNVAKPDSDEALGYVADVEPTEAVVKGSTIPGLMKTTELCSTTEIVTIDHVTGMQLGFENGSESVEREFKASSTEENPSTDMDDDEESSHEQTTAAEVTGALLDTHVVKRHLVYLIKVPRFTDEELEKKIQKAVSPSS